MRNSGKLVIRDLKESVPSTIFSTAGSQTLLEHKTYRSQGVSDVVILHIAGSQTQLEHKDYRSTGDCGPGHLPLRRVTDPARA